MHLADMSSLSPTARVILGLLSFEPRTGYDIKQVTDRSTRFFWGASYGQIYPELRRLEAAGLVESHEEPRGRVPRRVYRLTDDGRRAFESWLSEPERSVRGARRGAAEALLRRGHAGRAARSARAAAAGVVPRGRRRSSVEIGEQVGPFEAEDPSGHVLRYGIELMEWNADWWKRLERELS